MTRPNTTTTGTNSDWQAPSKTRTMAVLGLFCLLFGFACSNDRSGAMLPRARYLTGLPPGSSAVDLLAAGDFNSLTVEIQAVKGFAPTTDALKHFQGFLEQRLNKPNGIVINVSDALSSVGATYADSDLRRMESRFRRYYPALDDYAVYFLFVDGASASDATALAQTPANSSVVVFENTLRQAVAQNSEAKNHLWAVEATLLEHQFGRLLGLVHNPLAFQSAHEDPAHAGYCSVGGCLMSFAVPSVAWISSIHPTDGALAPPALDEQCLKDLKAAGGK